jgi:4-hydroxy-3-polyprenylbenzoate decarboxylase
MYKNLNHFVEILEKNNELIRISEFVDPILEITEITDRISKTEKGGKALLFENTGTNFPVLTNALGSEKRISLALGVENLSSLSTKINDFIKSITSPKNKFSEKIQSISQIKQIAKIFPQKTKKASCQEIIHKNPDIGILPILKSWPLDAGRFITLPVVHTKDPNTGIRNVGMYRMQVFKKDMTAMHWHKHKVGARHYEEYKKLNKKMPVAVSLGGDPVYTYCATAPLPDNIDEYLLAGFLRNKPVKLVKCISQDIEVPADADIVIEGYIDPAEELIWEGPFGDHTGFYSAADYYPKFHITCITHKKNAIYPATIVGVPPQEDAYIAKATEKIFLPLIQKSIAPEIIDMNIPQSGVAHNFTIIKITKSYKGQAFKVMNSLWGNGQMSLNKCLFVTDNEKLDISDYKQTAMECLKNFNPKTDTFFSKGPMDVLEHASEEFIYGSKIGFDFTSKQKQLNQNTKITIPELSEIKNILPQQTEINSLLNQNIPILIILTKKEQKIINYAKKIVELTNTSALKAIIFIDNIIDKNNLYLISWLIGSNIAPMRDIYTIKSNKFNNQILIIDATAKNKKIDNFDRIWPQITIMDKKIINKINQNWNKYKVGNFIQSPSLKFNLF